MNYKQALAWLYGLQRFGIKLGLENIRRLLDECCSGVFKRRALATASAFTPKVIHVAGTNGKGSVCAMIASASDSTAESLFDVRWAKTLTSGALNSLRQELRSEGKSEIFEQLKSFLIGGSVILSYDEASTRTGLPAATVKTHVHRLRLRYREIVRREVARTVSAPHEIDEELRYLYTVLAEAA